MSTYGITRYGTDKYGLPVPVTVVPGGTPLPTVSNAYLIDPFVATPVDYRSVLLTWNGPAPSSGTPMTEFRLLSSRWGFPVDENDGNVLLDTTSKPGSHFLDTNVVGGQMTYYAMYINTGSAWVRAGFTACLVPVNHEYASTLWRYLPEHLRVVSNGELTGDAAGNTYLWQFLQVMGWSLDFLKTQYDFLLNYQNNPMKMSFSDLADIAGQLGMPFSGELPGYFLRKAAANWATVMRQRGSLPGIAEHISLLSGFGADIQLSRNIMLENDQSLPYHPRFTPWSAGIPYQVGETVSWPVYPQWVVSQTYVTNNYVVYNGVNYQCLGTVTGIPPVGATTSGTYWAIAAGPYFYTCTSAITALPGTAPPAVGAAGSTPTGSNSNWQLVYDWDSTIDYLGIPGLAGGVNTWEVLSAGLGATTPNTAGVPANSLIEGLGVRNPSNFPNDFSQNSFRVTNRSGALGAIPMKVGGNNVTVDFTATTNPVSPLGIGISVTGYDGNGNNANITKSTPWLNSITALGPNHVRLPFRYSSGNPGIGAAGAQTSGDALNYVNLVKNTIKAIPVVVYLGDTSDNVTLNATDAGNFVSYFNTGGGSHYGPVKYWVLGNEPDNGNNDPGYVSAMSAIMSAMRAADSTIKISAPAAAYWDTSLLSSAASHGPDILSWHEYDGGNTGGNGFPTDPQYGSNTVTAKGYLPGGHVGVEECNWAPSYGAPNTTQFYDWHNANFIADAAGQVLSNGGHFTMYGDSNGPLGLMNDGSGLNSQPGTFGTTFPAYYAIGIWTGMAGQFLGLGAHMVSASTTFTGRQVTAFACDNGKIVVCNNTASTQALTIGLTLPGGATTGTYNVWITNGTTATSPITHAVSNASFTGSSISYTIPAQTVASIDVAAATGGSGSTQDMWFRSISRSQADIFAGSAVPDPQLVIEHGIPVPQTRVTLNEWNETTRYSTGDVVLWGGVNYLAQRASKGAQPPAIGVPVNANWDFETGITPWVVNTGGTIAQSAAHAYHGTHSLEYTYSGSATNVNAGSGNFNVIPGAAYKATVWVYSPAGAKIQVTLTFNDGYGQFVTGAFPGAVTLTAATWTLYTVTATAPANAAQASMNIQIDNPASGAFTADTFWDLAEVVCTSTPEWLPLGTDSRIPLMVSAQTSQDFSVAAAEQFAIYPFAEWYDNWGNLVSRVFARTLSNYTYDSFATGTGMYLSGRATDTADQTWTLVTGGWLLDGNGNAYPATAGVKSLAIVQSALSATQAVTFTQAPQSGTDAGLIFWYQNSTLYWHAGTAGLWYLNGATWTEAATYTHAFSPGDRIYVVTNQATPSITVYRNAIQAYDSTTGNGQVAQLTGAGVPAAALPGGAATVYSGIASEAV